MSLLTQAIKGTQDTLPCDSHKIKFVETTLADIAAGFGFAEIRTPVFEHTELFSRGVGDTTDVVQKEMYTFDDKGGRSITLRPEGTAGAMRSFLEHGLFNEPMPLKVYYQTSCYRYEKPQAGRLREFHQFGAECFGTDSPSADAEMISFANEIFSFFGLSTIELQINSIGCPKCREEYHNALKSYFESHKDKLCDTCKDRLERNPMRILDCKSPECSEISKDAPVILDYLCEECKNHFDKVKEYLHVMEINYVINPKIVRGLDYYTRTVFEFVSNNIGAQGTVLGGGRYDGLSKELGGNDIPALGFAMGMERFMLLLQSENCELPEPDKCDLYIVSCDEKANLTAAKIALELRQDGAFVLYDTVGRSLKSQMKYANKIGAKFLCVIGEDELQSDNIEMKCMESGQTTSMKLSTLSDTFGEYMIKVMTEELSSQYADLDGVDLSAVIDKLGGNF